MTLVRSALVTSVTIMMAALIAIFAFLQSVPGGALGPYLLNPHITEQEIGPLKHGYDEPQFLQFADWLRRIASIDFGWSQSDSEPVSQALLDRLPASLQLMAVALVLAAALFAIKLIVAPADAGKVPRAAFAALGLLGRAVPVFVLALIVQFLALQFRFPTAGIASRDDFDWHDRFVHLELPAIALAVPLAAWVTRHVEDGKVPAPSAIVALLLSAMVLVETIFAWPGVGRLIFNAINQRDIPLVQAAVIVLAVVFVLLNLLVDVLYARLDPRVRLA